MQQLVTRTVGDYSRRADLHFALWAVRRPSPRNETGPANNQMLAGPMRAFPGTTRFSSDYVAPTCLFLPSFLQMSYRSSQAPLAQQGLPLLGILHLRCPCPAQAEHIVPRRLPHTELSRYTSVLQDC